MRKFLLLTTTIIACALGAWGADENGRPVLLLTGASFAIPENGWFEIGCDDMNAVAINKSVSGEAIYHTARRMDKGTFYTTEELDRIDVFVIGHVHNQNVANEQWLKDSWEDYTSIATTTDYSVAYDYVIKRYIADCKALKDNPESIYYGTEEGKPVKIILCTHWHDSRTTYNPAIRKLAEKWDFPLVEFDKNIGFSKDDVSSGEPQPSLAMAHDTETINGVKYGWHPLRGSNSHIQRRMAQIFIETAAPVIDVETPFECSLTALSPVVMPGENAAALISFRAGHYPFELSYSAQQMALNHEAFKDAVHIAETPVGDKGATFGINSLTDSKGTVATLPEPLTVDVAYKSIAPSFDAYIHEAYKSQSYADATTLQLKNGDNWSRKIYLTFPTADIDDKAKRIVVRIFFDSFVLGTLANEKRPLDGIETLEIEGNTNVYGSNLNWNSAASHQFEPIASTSLTSNMVEKWIGWDVTDWAKEKIAEGATNLTFRITTPYLWRSLTNFISSENTEKPNLAPQMLLALPQASSSIEDVTAGSSTELLDVYSITGQRLMHDTTRANATTSLTPGLYIIGSEKTIIR